MPNSVEVLRSAAAGLRHPAWQGKPMLSGEEIEDVVAFLETLRN
jgi:hypothetical protein